ncbi:MAG: hypothetical protein C0467_24425 [Planctomycetaceae bacterium]|nr:hypothetical protein [Planctomycetaceae bacterium]
MSDHKVEIVDWFAQREEGSYRDEARNILDSYAHPWDILAELAQNAVDAIDQKRSELGTQLEGAIEIEIDTVARSVRVRDNGVGIGDGDLKRVLHPHFSRKRGRSLRGEKGVGLTYIALTGNRFEIVTKTSGVTRQLTVTGSQDWMCERGDRPQLRIEPAKDDSQKESSYTNVTVAEIPKPAVESDDIDIFSLSFQQLEYLLRTRTAIGWTGALFRQPVPAQTNVQLIVRKKNAEAESRLIDFSYASPETRLPKKMQW